MSYRTYHLLVFFVLVAVLFQTPSVNGQDPCNKINSCSCKNSKGTIDLSPLDSGGGNNPKFKDIPAADQNAFSWNPCTPFSEGQGTCTSVAACQITTDGTCYPTGTQDSALFTADSTGGLTVQYSATDSMATTRTTIVKLVCDPNNEGTVTAQGEDPAKPTYYDLTYTGKYACPSAPAPPSGGGGGGLSVGSILCIIFFALLIVYAAGGVVVQVFVRKESGINSIPQSSFWIGLPSLIKDGFFFVVRLPKRGQYNKT